MNIPSSIDMPSLVCFGDNLDLIKSIPDESVDLIYTDPPFNRGYSQVRRFVPVGKHRSDLTHDQLSKVSS